MVLHYSDHPPGSLLVIYEGDFWASPKPVAWVVLTICSLQARGWGMENSIVGNGPTTGLCCCPEWVRSRRSDSTWDRGTNKGEKPLRNICNLKTCNEQIQLNKYFQVALSLTKPKKLGTVHRLPLPWGWGHSSLHWACGAEKKGLLIGWSGQRGGGAPCLLLPLLSQKRELCDLGIFLLLGGRWIELRSSKWCLLDLAWLSVCWRGWDYPQAPISWSGLSLLHSLTCQEMEAFVGGKWSLGTKWQRDERCWRKHSPVQIGQDPHQMIRKPLTGCISYHTESTLGYTFIFAISAFLQSDVRHPVIDSVIYHGVQEVTAVM